MKRCNFSIRTRTTVAQRRPADYTEKLANFRSYCEKHIADKRIQPSHITNMDEVPLTFDIPVSHTVEKKGTSTVAIRTTGYEKASFTVVLGCCANGQKLPPMVIFKRKTLPKETFPAGVIIKANEKGWMDEDMMKEWLKLVYVRRPGGFFHTSPSLLICDSMRAHLTADVKQKVKQMNATLAVIPGGLTKELQPLDIGVNRPFKPCACTYQGLLIQNLCFYLKPSLIQKSPLLLLAPTHCPHLTQSVRITYSKLKNLLTRRWSSVAKQRQRHLLVYLRFLLINPFLRPQSKRLLELKLLRVSDVQPGSGSHLVVFIIPR
ncbi:hypothetical protein OJAV_G00219260 [Oryzias javanicus]|uniref:DDE-1 domain-containing protein n=1 Tax=Oryzias javanicus TaxID=123683 RepID=A0A3S2P3I4_ORYJA|nr:hypothetical protein OJAV_G00219260 [Oryzias javanicus]